MSNSYDNTTRKLLLIAVILGLVSLALPWWNLVVFHHGQLLAYFGSHLWGVVKTGFLKSDFPYEWWSYTTFALIGFACASGLFGYNLLKRNQKTAKALVLLEIAVTLFACVFYMVFLTNAFPTLPELWFIQGGNPIFTAEIVIYRLFYFPNASELDVFWAEFLSAGFFLALASVLFSLIVLNRITNALSKINNPNPAK